jgi:hypothetical protein
VVNTYTIPTYAANDVAFTFHNGKLYAAFSFIESQMNEAYTRVDIYEVDPDKSKDFTLVKSLDWIGLNVSNSKEFCPTQVEFDPVRTNDLHILSDCTQKNIYHTSNKIYTYTLGTDSILSLQEPVSFDVDPNADLRGSAKFCPFEDNFVVYSL